MKFRGLYKNSQIFKLALGIAIIVIGYIASVFYTKLSKLDDSVELIAISNQTQLELEKMLSVISNYENSVRSYIITKEDHYLKDRFLSRGEITININKLRKITSGNEIAAKDLDSLKILFDKRYDLFRQTLIIAKAENPDKNELNGKLLESTEFTNKMRAFVYKRINAEASNVRKLNDDHQFELKDSILSAFLLVLISLLILLLSFNKMNVDIKQLKQTNDELIFLNHSFSNAEKIAGFGYWKYNLETQTYMFSDNFYRLMGLTPNSFQATLENALKYIHPDDVEYASKIHHQSLIDLQPTRMVIRYILDNGDLRYITSVGSFTKNSKSQLVKVGVNYDITEQYLKTLEVEANNKELKVINEELESFNNIVSHDLQEPLRKIQMFISRLEESDEQKLSLQGKDYFLKIRAAANRMQTLMMDLVNYTRTIKGDRTFVTTNLNKLMDQILQELAINIEDKKAKIKIGNLPVIQAIPFQIEQLFINLISNSIKYSKDGIAPKITISLEKITTKEMHYNVELSQSKFHKIVVADNGIGFKQEYSEKIFMLFQRLETDAKYSGTGLGLAICKRIVENHGGYIKVNSKPNEGTKFSIYFPKV